MYMAIYWWFLCQYVVYTPYIYGTGQLYTYTYTRTHTHRHTLAHTHTHTGTHLRTHTHTHTHAHTHTNTHTHIQHPLVTCSCLRLCRPQALPSLRACTQLRALGRGWQLELRCGTLCCPTLGVCVYVSVCRYVWVGIRSWNCVAEPGAVVPSNLRCLCVCECMQLRLCGNWQLELCCGAWCHQTWSACMELKCVYVYVCVCMYVCV